MTLYLTGDTHGKLVKRFNLNRLNFTDTFIILGDCGVPFGINNPAYPSKFLASDLNQLQFLQDLGCEFIFMAGNHDDRDAISAMPYVCKHGTSLLRQMALDNHIFPNIYYLSEPAVLDIQNKHVLMIPGAKSHDIDDGILDPYAQNFKEKYKLWSRQHRMFRINHYNWWEGEDIDIPATKQLLAGSNQVFDLVLTHDAPSKCALQFCRLNPTPAEHYLQDLTKQLAYGHWYHGHFHENWSNYYPGLAISCIFTATVRID